MAFSFSLTPNKTTPGLFTHTEFNSIVNALTSAVAAYPMATISTPASLGLFPNKSAGQKMTSTEYNSIVTILGGVATAANGTGTTPTPTATKASSPYFGAIDDINNIVTLGSNYSFTEVRWGVEGQGAQALASNSICSPGNIAGRLFAYVIADAASNRLQSDTVYSSPFSLNAVANNAPTATISLASGTSNVTAGQTVTLNLAGADSDGTVTKVEALDNGVKIGEVSGASGALQSAALTEGTHNFTAKAYDDKGASGLSVAVTVTATPQATTTPTPTPTPSATAPAVVNNVVLVAGYQKIAASWPAPVDNGAPIQSYTVKYRPVGASTYSVFGTTANTRAVITGIDYTVEYEVVVAATNANGTGAYSNPVRCRPSQGTPTTTTTGGGGQPLQTSDFGASKTLVYDGSTETSFQSMTFQTVQVWLKAKMPAVHEGTFHFFDADSAATANVRRIASSAYYDTIQGISPDWTVRKNGQAYTKKLANSTALDFSTGFVSADQIGSEWVCITATLPEPVTTTSVLMGRLAAPGRSDLFTMAGTIGRVNFYSTGLTDVEANSQQLITDKLVATFTNKKSADGTKLLDESGNDRHATFIGNSPAVGASGASAATGSTTTTTYAPPTAVNTTLPAQIVFFGDSRVAGLTSGNPFPEIAQTALGAKYVVVNKGHEGYDTDQLLSLATSEIIPLHKPGTYAFTACFLLLGVNDRYNNNAGAKAFTTSKTLANYEAIVRRLVAAGIIVFACTETNLYLDSIVAPTEVIRQSVRDNAMSWGAASVVDFARTQPLTTAKDFVFMQDVVHPNQYMNNFLAGTCKQTVDAYAESVGFPVSSGTVSIVNAYVLSTYSLNITEAAAWRGLKGTVTPASNTLVLSGGAVAVATKAFKPVSGRALLGFVRWTANTASNFMITAVSGPTADTSFGQGLWFQQEGNTGRHYGDVSYTVADRYQIVDGDEVQLQFEDSKEPSLGSNSTRITAYVNGKLKASYHYVRPSGDLQLTVVALGNSTLENVKINGANLVAA
jgi:hypothetical protein